MNPLGVQSFDCLFAVFPHNVCKHNHAKIAIVLGHIDRCSLRYHQFTGNPFFVKKEAVAHKHTASIEQSDNSPPPQLGVLAWPYAMIRDGGEKRLRYGVGRERFRIGGCFKEFSF